MILHDSREGLNSEAAISQEASLFLSLSLSLSHTHTHTHVHMHTESETPTGLSGARHRLGENSCKIYI